MAVIQRMKSGRVEEVLLKICEALVKKVCSTNITKSFASRLFIPVFGKYAIIQQFKLVAAYWNRLQM